MSSVASYFKEERAEGKGPIRYLLDLDKYEFLIRRVDFDGLLFARRVR